MVKKIKDSLKIAVLFDADNADHSKVKYILDELSAHGNIIVKKAYGDWSTTQLKPWKTVMNENSIQPIQQFAFTKKKNSTDIALVIDAMDLLFSDKFDAFALVSSDSDFTGLARRIKQSEVYVFGIGRKTTPIAFINACDDFIMVENLGLQTTKTVVEDKKKMLENFIKAWEKHQDADGWTNLASAGDFVKRISPDFDPRTYGVPSISALLNEFKSEFDIKKEEWKGTTVKLFRYKKAQT